MTAETRNRLLNSLPNDQRDAARRVRQAVNETAAARECGEITEDQYGAFRRLVADAAGLDAGEDGE